ncbi:alpha/beta fold hydrolase [Mucilaginibacter endophyticus]|uniref:alpha/beta fold hydrolase n=1 Tax=Mucilaginibacter endophyticus TaxID=2675003 RepID=UPI000E0D5B78|nr:alpha/beta hydrolase [Mucilaginibacter endophyticus]
MKLTIDSSSPALEQGEHFFYINGFTMHCYIRGNGPVALIPSPGWGPSVDYMMPLTALEDFCTVVYFDTRHSGKSTGPKDPSLYSLENFIADIEALRKFLKQPKIFVAGHSGAGHQALAYGIACDERLYGIIAIDAIAAQDELRFAEMSRRIAKKKNEPYYTSHPEYYNRASELMRSPAKAQMTIKQIIDVTGGFYFYRPELAKEAFNKMECNDDVLKYTQEAAFQTKNLLPELHHITVPTLIISGEDDFMCDPISQAQRIHENISSSKLVIIKESGHMPWIEQPKAFNLACQNWLEETFVLG